MGAFLFFELNEQLVRSKADVNIEQWNNLAVSVTYTEEFESYLKFVLNNKPVDSTSIAEPVLDKRSNLHTIGWEFNGFIYSLDIYSFANPTYNVQTCSGCDTCPGDECLSLCEWNEYQEGTRCLPC